MTMPSGMTVQKISSGVLCVGPASGCWPLRRRYSDHERQHDRDDQEEEKGHHVQQGVEHQVVVLGRRRCRRLKPERPLGQERWYHGFHCSTVHVGWTSQSGLSDLDALGQTILHSQSSSPAAVHRFLPVLAVDHPADGRRQQNQSRNSRDPHDGHGGPRVFSRLHVEVCEARRPGPRRTGPS